VKAGGLVFEWGKRRSSVIHNWLAWIMATGIFTFFLGFFNVRMDPVRAEVSESVAVFQFTDQGMGRSLAQIAEEQGPFPGRLELAGDAVVGSGEVLETFDVASSTDYEPGLREFQALVGSGGDSLSQRGVLVFPNRERRDPSSAAAPAPTRLVPKLIPYERETSAWLPEVFPEFQMPDDGAGTLESSRFVLALRADGSVEHCLSVGGTVTAVTQAVEEWLRRVRFQAGEEGRWLGLRVEFINRDGDGS
jgi:hypothetical protein